MKKNNDPQLPELSSNSRENIIDMRVQSKLTLYRALEYLGANTSEHFEASSVLDELKQSRDWIVKKNTTKPKAKRELSEDTKDSIARVLEQVVGMVLGSFVLFIIGAIIAQVAGFLDWVTLLKIVVVGVMSGSAVWGLQLVLASRRSRAKRALIDEADSKYMQALEQTIRHKIREESRSDESKGMDQWR